jgi:hypothetical protein
MMSGAVFGQTNRTLSANELETARLGIYLRLAAERCGYKLRYNPIHSIYSGPSLLDVVSPESKKHLTDITMQEMTKFFRPQFGSLHVLNADCEPLPADWAAFLRCGDSA